MTQVTVNSQSYSDDGTTARDMRNMGHAQWFLRFISDFMIDVAAKLVTAAGHVSTAGASASAAAASAATAINAPGTQATSSTSLTVGTGPQSLTVQTGKSLATGMFLMIASTASPSNWMLAQVTSYDSGTGALAVTVATLGGAGTFTAWTVSLSTPGAEDNAPAAYLFAHQTLGGF